MAPYITSKPKMFFKYLGPDAELSEEQLGIRAETFGHFGTDIKITVSLIIRQFGTRSEVSLCPSQARSQGGGGPGTPPGNPRHC